jgi:predicted membrane protein
MATVSADDLAARRRLIARLTTTGQRLGYLLYLAAAALFFTGFATSFRSSLVTAIIACLLVGSLVLAPAIIFSYAVRAADREEPLP